MQRTVAKRPARRGRQTLANDSLPFRHRLAPAFAAALGVALVFAIRAPGWASSSDVTVGETALANGSFAQAKSAFARAAARDPGDAEAQLGVARIALYENRLGDAQAALNHVLARSPHDALAASMLLDVQRRRGRPEDFAVKRYPGTVEMNTGGAVPVVRVRLNGGNAFLFAVDTTASGVYLSQATARALNYDPALPARLQSIAIGEGEIDNVPARTVEINPHELAGEEPVGGVLGVAFLSRFFVTLDFPGNRISLESPHRRSHTGADAAPMWQCDDRHLFTEARLNHAAPSLFSIDTGIAGGLLVTAQSIAAAHLSFDRVKLVQEHNTSTVRVLPITASLTLANHTFSNLDGALLAQGTPTGSFPFPVGGTIGNAALRGARLTLDFTNMRLTAAGPRP